MGRLISRSDALDEICFEVECLNFFSELKKKYRYTRLGIAFGESYELVSRNLRKLVREFEREYSEKLDLKLIKQL